jgi:acylphosphatase
MECHIYKNKPDGDIQYHFEIPNDEMEDLKAEMRESIASTDDLDKIIDNIFGDLTMVGIVIE